MQRRWHLTVSCHPRFCRFSRIIISNFCLVPSGCRSGVNQLLYSCISFIVPLPNGNPHLTPGDSDRLSLVSTTALGLRDFCLKSIRRNASLDIPLKPMEHLFHQTTCFYFCRRLIVVVKPKIYSRFAHNAFDQWKQIMRRLRNLPSTHDFFSDVPLTVLLWFSLISSFSNLAESLKLISQNVLTTTVPSMMILCAMRRWHTLRVDDWTG